MKPRFMDRKVTVSNWKQATDVLANNDLVIREDLNKLIVLFNKNKFSSKMALIACFGMVAITTLQTLSLYDEVENLRNRVLTLEAKQLEEECKNYRR